jgi:hypothetical protein
MAEMPENEFVEVRNGGYYVRGTRIPLDVLVWGLVISKASKLSGTNSVGSTPFPRRCSSAWSLPGRN